MEQSILKTVRKLVTGSPDDTSFDMDIMIHINSTFLALTQIGVGPSTGFYIQDDTKLWTDCESDLVIAEALKTYVYIKVRLVFDPPTNQVVVAALEKSANEQEWRIREWVENKPTVII